MNIFTILESFLLLIKNTNYWNFGLLELSKKPNKMKRLIFLLIILKKLFGNF